MKYGNAMRTARRNRGFSQAMLERKAGVDVRNINNYENEKVMPGLYNLVALANALNISIDEYIGRELKP